jgi:hypothetical protein
MALRDAMWLENAGAVYNAGDYRRMLEGILAGTAAELHGICGGAGDLKVSQQGSPAMGITVAIGSGIVDGTESATQGIYVVVNDAAADVSIAASDPSNPRIDLVGVRIRDDEFSGANHVADLFIVQGTAAASPSRPTAPDNFLELAEVDVPAGASSITNAEITDTRVPSLVWARGRGNIDAVEQTASQNVTTTADITGVTITWTAVAGRRYASRAHTYGFSSVGGAAVQTFIRDGSNAILSLATYNSPTNAYSGTMDLRRTTEPAAGSTTRKLSGAAIVSGTATIYYDVNQVANLTVDDVGGYLV